jgi:restriction system protein
MDRRRRESIFDVLWTLPWWASLVAAVVVFVVLKYVVPAFASGNHFLGVLAAGLKRAAPYIAILLLAIAPAAYLRRLFRRRLLGDQTDLESLCAMNWPQFELLVGDGFQRLGYSVEEKGGAAQYDGIDLVLRKDGATTLVQCKQWRAKQVDVSSVRELYGVMIAERASGALLITTGRFTLDTVAFASGKPIGLIDGNALLELVQSVQKEGSNALPTRAAQPSCHVCTRPMVRRKARRGLRSTGEFWRCSAHPSCKATRAV